MYGYMLCSTAVQPTQQCTEHREDATGMEKKHISAFLGAKEIYNNVTIPVE